MDRTNFISELKSVLNGKEASIELNESIQNGINRLKLETTQFNGELGHIVSINKDGVHWVSEKGKLYTNISLNEISIYSLNDNITFESFLDNLSLDEASTLDIEIFERPTLKENETEFYVKLNNKPLVIATQKIKLNRKSTKDKKFNLEWNFDNIEKVIGVMNYSIEDDLENIAIKQNVKFTKTIISTHLKNIVMANKSKKHYTENQKKVKKIVWSTKTKNNVNVTLQKDVKILGSDDVKNIEIENKDIAIDYLNDTMKQFLTLIDTLSQEIYSLKKDISNIKNENIKYQQIIEKKLSQISEIKKIKESIDTVEKNGKLREKELFVERVLLNFSEREKLIFESQINDIKNSEENYDIIKSKLLGLISNRIDSNTIIENTITPEQNNSLSTKNVTNNVSKLNLDENLLEIYRQKTKNL